MDVTLKAPTRVLANCPGTLVRSPTVSETLAQVPSYLLNRATGLSSIYMSGSKKFGPAKIGPPVEVIGASIVTRIVEGPR